MAPRNSAKKVARPAATPPAAPPADAPPSPAEVKAASKAADQAEAARQDNTYRLDRGEALPPQPFKTATDNE